jgi:hypothetical protein
VLEPVRPGTGAGASCTCSCAVDHAPSPTSPGAAKEVVATLERGRSELQLHVFSVLGHKADVMLMALDDDLTELRALQTDVLGHRRRARAAPGGPTCR